MGKQRFERAFITGASSGLGAELARQLAARGVEVVIAARREPELRRLEEEIRGKGGMAHVQVLDVGAVDILVESLRGWDERLGGLDLVIANAGLADLRWSGALGDEEAVAQARQIVDVNVKGAMSTLTALLPRMVERGRGHLVGITSMAGQRGLPHNAVYGASKAFLSTFLEALRVDLEGAGLKVTEIRPGYVRTPMLDAKKMLFEVPCDEAARRIIDGLYKGDRLIAFPWPMVALVRAISWLPTPVYVKAARWARPRE